MEDGRTCYTVSHKKDEFIDLVLMPFGEVIKYNAPDKYFVLDPGNKIPDQEDRLHPGSASLPRASAGDLRDSDRRVFRL